MPADRDPSKGMILHASRRQFRKISTEEEIELKRARGEISCAECRRLKLKCDKKLPCGSCVRRGCPTICPNGSLSTGQGTRFVLADTEHLHRKIAEMGHRIRSLEDALAISQAGASNDVHPLLTEELLAIKYGLETTPREASGDQHAVQINGSGTLTITERGDSHYFGRTGGPETLFLAGAELSGADPGSSSASNDGLPRVSSEISHLASLLPFNLADVTDEDKRCELLDEMLSLLPDYPRATTLCETYLENAAWMVRPIVREEVIDEILAPIYAFAQARKMETSEVTDEPAPHTLAVLYMIFAHGALTDLTLPAHNSEAENYFHLARMALSLHPIHDLPNLHTLQALCLIAYYYGNHGRHLTLDSAWSILSFANKVAQSVGLHRDPARFNLSPKAIQRRRALFWELLSADMYHSMALGRPPSISLSYVDCEFPEDDTETINDKGEVETGYFHWKYSFVQEVFIPVVELTLGVTPPSYETVLELDRKVREKVLPPPLNLYRSSSVDEYSTPTTYARGRMLFQFRTATMLHLHRAFFAQAMLDFPSNPLRSPFAPSFLAAYRCASAIIKTTAMNLQKYPDLFTRFWAMWSHLLTAAIVVGTIATRAPSSTMAPAAQLEVDLALNMFKSSAAVSPRARCGLALLMHLKAKSQQAQGQSALNSTAPGASAVTLLPETGVDELAVFGGQTRILVSKILSQQSRRSVPSASPSMSVSSAGSPSAISEDSHPHSDSVPEVHPSLVEYLSMLPTPTIPSPPAAGTSPVSSQFLFNQNSTFQSEAFAGVSPVMASGSSSFQQTFPSATFPSAFDDNFTIDFSDAAMFGSNSSEASANSFDNMELLISGESGIDERWVTLMQDMLNPPVS